MSTVFSMAGETTKRMVQPEQVFSNLISNGIKYNDIGIEPAFDSVIFDVFRRLHARDEYGGGSGAGKGTAVRFTLAAKADAAREAAANA